MSQKSSQNSIVGLVQPQAAIPQQGAGKLEQAQVMFRFLVVAHQNGAALGQPSESAFDDPAPRWIFASRFRDRRFPSPAHIPTIMAPARDAPARGPAITLVQ